MKKLNLFRLDETLKTYTYPILKIVFSIAIILLLLLFQFHFHQIDHWKLTWQFIEKAVAVNVFVACVLCIYISSAEIDIVYDNRHKIHKLTNEQIHRCMWFSVDRIVSFTGQNDVIEIQIVSGGSCIKVGASSDIKPGSSIFFDKIYYIGNKEFENLKSFQEELLNYSVDGQIQIFQIDGLSPKHYRL